MSVFRLPLSRAEDRHQGQTRLSFKTQVQQLWIQAQLNAPPWVQDQIVPALHDAKEIARLLRRPKLPLYRIEGVTESGPLAVHAVGNAGAKSFALRRLFGEKPTVRQNVGVAFWQPAALTGAHADMVILSSTRRLIRRLPSQNAFVLPEFVYHELDLAGDWEDVQSRFHSGVRRDQRLLRRYDYQYEISHVHRDLEVFYHQMYLPTLWNRYGEHGAPMSLAQAHQYLDHGTLFKVLRDGRWVSSSLCYARQGVLRFLIMGVLNGDAELTKEGAVGAMNFLRLQWAQRNGYRAVNFLGTGPILNIGLFQYKRKWGTRVSVPSTLHRRVWIHVRRVNPAVASWLKENPLIVLGEDGSLHGLITVDDLGAATEGAKKDWIKHYATPGLKSLRVYTVDQFAAGEMHVASPQLVIPLEPTDSRS